MEIKLTPHQWTDLKKIVAQGAHAERRMGYPIEIVNGDILIEIEESETKIVLVDEE